MNRSVEQGTMCSSLRCWECGQPHHLERPLPKHGLCDRCEDIYQADRRAEQDDEVDDD